MFHIKTLYKKIALPILTIGLLFSISCQEEKQDLLKLVYNAETVPTLDTDSVVQLISDSGVVKYKLEAKKWLMFDKAIEPHSLFPQGFYFEQMDTLMHPVVKIKSDSAWNYTRKKLWRLKGNVLIVNSLNDKFMSEEFFWDEQAQKIYTNTDVTIDQPNKILSHAKRFESNQQMTNWKLFEPYEVDIHVKEDEDIDEQDKTQNKE